MLSSTLYVTEAFHAATERILQCTLAGSLEKASNVGTVLLCTHSALNSSPNSAMFSNASPNSARFSETRRHHHHIHLSSQYTLFPIFLTLFPKLWKRSGKTIVLTYPWVNPFVMIFKPKFAYIGIFAKIWTKMAFQELHKNSILHCVVMNIIFRLFCIVILELMVPYRFNSPECLYLHPSAQCWISQV